MSAYLYLTADDPGLDTGGGKVVRNELQALGSLGEVTLLRPAPSLTDPFCQDVHVLEMLRQLEGQPDGLSGIRLAHAYAGCFTESCAYLKANGVPVTYTVAAHDIAASRAAHEAEGVPFAYPHLNDPHLFGLYAGGYLRHADCVVVPGEAPRSTVARQLSDAGRCRKGGPALRVIPHGIDPPARVDARPRREFAVGYLGAYGPDKGVRTLLDAWASLQPLPGARLILAGRDSAAYAHANVGRLAGAVSVAGRVADVSSFYDRLAVYVQPAATEGFGIPALEALAHGVPAVVSQGAGAADAVPMEFRFPAGDAAALVDRLKLLHGVWKGDLSYARPLWSAEAVRGRADHIGAAYAWPVVRGMYRDLWEEYRR